MLLNKIHTSIVHYLLLYKGKNSYINLLYMFYKWKTSYSLLTPEKTLEQSFFFHADIFAVSYDNMVNQFNTDKLPGFSNPCGY